MVITSNSVTSQQAEKTRKQIVSETILKNTFTTFMVPQYTLHLYSVNSPSSTQTNPVFTSGIGTQQQKAQWEEKERS